MPDNSNLCSISSSMNYIAGTSQIVSVQIRVYDETLEYKNVASSVVNKRMQIKTLDWKHPLYGKHEATMVAAPTSTSHI